MSKTTQKKKTISPKNNSSGRKSMNKKSLWIAIFVILTFTLLIFWLTIGKSLLRQAEMTSYLKNKYNEDFVVKKPEYKNGGFGVRGIWVAQAHPVNNPQLDFNISCSSTDTSDCSDQYVATLWSVQATDEIKGLISNINANNKDKISDAQIKIILTGNIKNNVNKSSSYKEYRSREDDIKHLVILNVSSSSDEKTAALTDKVIKGLLEQGVRLNKIDIDVSSSDGTCKAYDLPMNITADFISKCNNSRLEWYNGD